MGSETPLSNSQPVTWLAGSHRQSLGPSPSLRASNIYAGYGKAEVLFGVSIEVSPGECVTLLGANGAGKTTLVRALTGIVAVRSGEVTLGTRGITNLRADRIVRAGVAHVPQGRGLFPTMSVEDNIRIGGYTLARRSVERRVVEVLGMFPQLAARRRQAAGSLSGGEQQMVAMMRALMMAPLALVLDEPTLGLSPMVRDGVLELIQGARGAGIAVLLVEQNARKALEVSDKCYVMRSGRIVYEASAAEALGAYEQLADRYLGAEAGPQVTAESAIDDA